MKGEPKSLFMFASGMFLQEIFSKVQEHNLRNGFTLTVQTVLFLKKFLFNSYYLIIIQGKV
jgi:hypothetical protein